MARNTTTFGQLPPKAPANDDIFAIQGVDGINYRFTAEEFSIFVGSFAILSINGDTTNTQIIAGTAGRIFLVDAGPTHTFDIDAAYVGQASIITLGTITTGVWNGTPITGANINAALVDLSDVTAKTGTGTVVVMDTSPTIITPTIASYVNATHDHEDAAGGGNLAATAISDFDTEVSNNASVTANTAKITNASHTGDATGDTLLTIAADAVTYAKMQNVVADNVILGNVAGAGSIVAELTGAQVNLLLPNFTSTLDGLAPLSGGGITNFLRADGTWVVPAGSGIIASINGDGTPAQVIAAGDGMGLVDVGDTHTLAVDGTVARDTDDLSFFSTTTSLQLSGIISDETGSGLLVFATNPVLVTPNIGTPSAGTIDMSNVTLDGTKAEFDSAVSDGTFAFLNQANTYTGGGDQAFGGAKLIGIRHLEFDDVNTTISQSGPSILHDVALVGSHLLLINSTTVYAFNNTVADWGSRDLVNIGQLAVGQGAVTAGKTVAITIPDDTVSEGMIIQNTDGSIEIINGTGTVGAFSPVFRGNISLASSQTFFDSQITPADETGTLAMISLRAFRDDLSVIQNKPIMEILNFTTKLWEIDNDGSIVQNVTDDTALGYTIQSVDGSLFLGNNVGSAGDFRPALIGDLALTADTRNFMLSGQIDPTRDTGTEPVIRLDSRQNDDTTITTRPLLEITNNGIEQWLIDASGNVDMAGTLDMGANIIQFVTQIISNDVTPASTGLLRMGNNERLSWRDFGDSDDVFIRVNSADDFEVVIDGTSEFTVSDAAITLNNNILVVGSGIIQFNDVNTSILQSGSELRYDVATGGTHKHRINNIVMLTLSATELFLTGIDISGIQNLIHDQSASGTDIDFDEDEEQTINISANTTLTSVNEVAGKSKALRIITDSTLRTLTFPSGWRFVGVKPADQAASKIGILTLTCYGTADSDVVAAYAVEI